MTTRHDGKVMLSDDIADGQVPAWNDSEKRFRATDQPGGGSGVVQQATKTVTFDGVNSASTPGAGQALFTVSGEVIIVSLTVKCLSTVTIGGGGSGYSDFSVFIGDEDDDTMSRATVEVPNANTTTGLYCYVGGPGSVIGNSVDHARSFPTATSLTGCPAGGPSGNDPLTGGSLRIDVAWAPLTNGSTLVAA